MKTVIILVGLMLSSASQAHWWRETRAILKEYKYACRSVEVNIDSIERDKSIKGHVKGLPVEALDKFKMIFYVKTNRWYVHPFAGAGEGHTYANLNEHGEFQIKTVRREVPAQALAAVLVPRSLPIKSQRWWLRPFLGIFGGVLKYSCNHEIIKGNGDFLH